MLLLLDSARGVLRLNAEGTNLINGLDSESKKTEFINNLKNELAKMIPINPDRLNFIKYQTDYSTTPQTSLLLFKILKPTDNDGIQVAQIIDDLNTLIKNKLITGVSRNNYTRLIDETSGFTFTSKQEISIKKKFFLIGDFNTY